MVSTPKAPDPVATAQAQSGMNLDTALTQQLTNMVGQQGPWGSTSYGQTGASSFVDSTGKTITVPQFTQTTTYNPAQQAIFDKTTQAQTNLADIASEQSASLKDYLNTSFQFDNQDAADWSTDLASQRILPQQERQRAALETQLVNKGIRPGTAAWNSEMRRMSEANNDQLNQLALTGRSQAFSEQLAQRNQPINEISALLSGSQVSNPTTGFGTTPQANVAGVDYAGLVQQNYQNQMQSSQAGLGGLFGLAGALGGAAVSKYSDRRVKTDVRRVGTLDNGLPVYGYRYVWGGPMEIGVMAQDVERVLPAAVSEIDGIKAVDYAMVAAHG